MTRDNKYTNNKIKKYFKIVKIFVQIFNIFVGPNNDLVMYGVQTIWV